MAGPGVDSDPEAASEGTVWARTESGMKEKANRPTRIAVWKIDREFCLELTIAIR
jgi:hypothetical protein